MMIVCGSGDDIRNQFPVRESSKKKKKKYINLKKKKNAEVQCHRCPKILITLKLTSILDELVINKCGGGLNIVELHFSGRIL